MNLIIGEIREDYFLFSGKNKMDSKKYEYKNYFEYIELQIKRSRRTKGMTRRNSCNRRREWIYNRMTGLGIEGKSILCLGCRDEAEINFFENKGYKVDGIDLFNSGKIIACDMSKLLEYEYFKNKKYDIIFGMEAIEHCLNFEGLLKGINKLCKKYLIIMSPICGTKIIQKPDEWDCNFQPFMISKNITNKKIHDKLLLDTFKEFDIIVNEVYKRGKRLFFILKKKKEK